jgi:hypothetical protein
LRWQQKICTWRRSAPSKLVGCSVTNAAKELYRLAMINGHANEDFSAVYEYLASNYAPAKLNQRLPTFAKPQEDSYGLWHRSLVSRILPRIPAGLGREREDSSIRQKSNN